MKINKKLKLLLSLFIVCMMAFFLIKFIKTKKDINKLETNIPENVNITCFYTFTQKALLEEKIVILSDTVVLNIGPTSSLYYNKSSKERDSIFVRNGSSIPMGEINFIEKTKNVKLFESKTKKLKNYIGFKEQCYRETSIIYKNRKQHKIIIMDEATMDKGNYRYEEILSPPRWKFLSGTQNILGFECLKAETYFKGRKYTAWYTKEIPFDDGPWKVYGLPGLILQLQDDNSLFNFNAHDLKKTPNTTITIDTAGYTNYNYIRYKSEQTHKMQYAKHIVFDLNETLYIGILEKRLELNKMEIYD